MALLVERAPGEGTTVGVAAELVGVTVRTLHHWDEIGLASPSARNASGYRLYTEPDLERLHRIAVYRETGLGLDAIREVLDDRTAEISETLRDQRARLAERIHELELLDERLQRMTEAHERGVVMTEQEQADVFGEDWDPNRSMQARALWGGSTQWAQFAERSASRTHAQWQSLYDAMAALERDLVQAMAAAIAPGSDAANQLAERHRELFSNFFPLTRQMQVCLVRMFESDAGFASHYDGLRDGLATWFRQIVDESARSEGIDPENATWQ